jgi:GNAT superfamily N-acetyltransferase
MRAVPEWLAERTVRLPGQRNAAPESAPALPRGIRPRRPKDLPACARLLRVVATEHQYPARWPEAPRSWLAGPDVLSAYVAEEHGEILGHVAIATVPRNGISRVRWQEITGHDVTQLRRISRLFVRRRVRGQGIASNLLDVAVDEIRTLGLTPVLDVVSTSTDGIAFLEKRGWKLLAMDPWGSKTEHLRMNYYAAPPAPLRSARP